ncbi:hypothetical protein [Pedobacter agri]|uniref:hypothetical protein n=1 Tax=Pedobacter agri TaxID=454586 RepID=UPI00292F8564|nr:hypothetical protein [Pedobacter agri]
MRRIRILIAISTVIFSFIYFKSTAQNISRDSLVDQIRKGLIIDTKNLKDSIAFYSFSIRINLKRNKASIVAEDIIINDNIAFKILSNVNFLNQIDFTPIVGEAKQNSLIIPIGIIVANHEENRIYKHKIPVEDIGIRIDKLFSYDPHSNNKIENNLYLNPIIIYVDKAVYN